MKPFNLEKAQNGEPVCRKDGRPAKILDFNINGGILYKYYDEVEKTEFTVTANKDGRATGDSDGNLYMGKKIAWATIYKNEYSNELYSGKLCSTREEAEIQKEKLFSDMKKFCMAKIELIEEEEE